MASPNKKKILKNTTGSPVELTQVGVTVPASGQAIIEPGQYYLYANEIGLSPTGQLDNLILDGTIVVNDGVLDLIPANGISLDRAIDYLKYPDTAFNVRFLAQPERMNGFVAKNVQEAIEESRDTGANITGKLFTKSFSESGAAGNKWLEYESSDESSNDIRPTLMWDCELIGYSFTNEESNANTTIEIYKNGVAVAQRVAQIIVDKKRWQYSTQITPITFNRGDSVRVFLRKRTTGGGTDPAELVVDLDFKVTSNITSSNSGTTL